MIYQTSFVNGMVGSVTPIKIAQPDNKASVSDSYSFETDPESSILG